MNQTRFRIKSNALPINSSIIKEPMELLRFIYVNVNDQLKFAEGKNGALLVFNSGIIIGYLTLLPYNLSDCPFYLLIYSVSFVLLNIFAIGVSLLSLVPVLENTQKKAKNLDGEKNILFFSHLANLSEIGLLKRICTCLKIPNSACDEQLYLQISNQIITNSRIAARKHELFKISVWVTICGIFTPILGAIFFVAYSIYQAREIC